MLRSSLAILTLFFLSLPGAARADMGYIPPVNVHLQFENLDEFPQYDFYLKYGIGQGNPYSGLRLIKVESTAMFKLEGEGRRLTEVYLLAVPKGQSVAQPKNGHDALWLSVAPQNGLESSELLWKDLGRLNNYENPTAIYRIRIEGGKLTATWVAGEIPMQPWEKARLVIWSGLALSVLIIALGLFFILRWFRRRNAKSSDVLRIEENQ